MEILTIQVEDRNVMAGLKRVLKSMNGVAIVSNKRKKKAGIEEAREDIRCGRVTEYKSAEEMLEKLAF